MDKLRIAVYIDIELNPQIGGISSYYERLIMKIDNFDFDNKIEVVFLSKNIIGKKILKKPILQIPYSNIKNNIWTSTDKIINKIFSFGVLKYFEINQIVQKKVEDKINDCITNFLSDRKIDLIYYPIINIEPFNYPFIATHWDIGHKNMFFLDIFSKEKVEKREAKLRIVLQLAFAIFVESQQSKKDLVKFENIFEDKIFEVPLFAGKVIKMNLDEIEQQKYLKKWNLEKGKFYFYPAQFWAHKNQYGLVNAFKIVLEKHPNFKLILSGSDKGNMQYIKTIVDQLNIERSVIFTGFVSDDEVYSFYKNAIALVMPTLLGPTNMPLLEAYYLGCKVICSNLKGHKEQMGNNAIYFNPYNQEEMAQKMLDAILQNKPEIIKIETNTASILNDHFLSLYNIRKTFGY